MKKNRAINTRHEAIKTIITEHPVENQETLVNLLNIEHDIETNQSIVSRDLRELGITKQPVGDTLIYQLDTKDVTQEILQLGVTGMSHNEAMIIIKTRAGMADFVGDYLDSCTHTNILATLAGENVVLVIPSSTKNITTTFQQVAQLVHWKHKQ